MKNRMGGRGEEGVTTELLLMTYVTQERATSHIHAPRDIHESCDMYMSHVTYT